VEIEESNGQTRSAHSDAVPMSDGGTGDLAERDGEPGVHVLVLESSVTSSTSARWQHDRAARLAAMSGVGRAARGFLGRMFAMPSYPPDEQDLQTVRIAGLDLPVRASIAVVVVLLVVIFDFQRTLLPDALLHYDRNPEEQRMQAFSRLLLFLVVPLAIVLLGFRDRPERYGLRFGDWRWGLGLAVAGCVVMTPVVLVLAGQPDYRAYYVPSAESLPGLVTTNILDLFSTEFVYRGFLMLALARVVGPVGLVVALFPFTFTHLTKPESELLSTAAGGLVYGWFAWRTGSVVWGALAHVYIVTLLIVASAAAVGTRV
jgi:membrane protease YdiL (CAAX protease family)